jgi:acyl-CoA thioesterase-1
LLLTCASVVGISRVMHDRRLLFFGDSLVVGVGDPTGLGWVGRVVAAAFASDMPVTPYNLGVRAETSVDVAARWRSEAQPRLLAGAATGLVLSFGANDTTIQAGEQRVTPKRSQSALATILDEAATMALPALVVGPAPVDDAEQNRRIEDLSASFADVCASRETPFVSVFAPTLASPEWMAEISASDGAHPSSGGYTVLAEFITDTFLDWLRLTIGKD